MYYDERRDERPELGKCCRLQSAKQSLNQFDPCKLVPRLLSEEDDVAENNLKVVSRRLWALYGREAVIQLAMAVVAIQQAGGTTKAPHNQGRTMTAACLFFKFAKCLEK